MKIFMIGFLLVITCTANLTSCKPVSTNFIIYKKGVVVPVLVLPVKPKGVETKAGSLFVNQFKLLTGTTLKVISETDYKSSEKQVAIFIGKTQASAAAKAQYNKADDGFSISQNKQNVFITYNRGLGILYGVSTFFEQYAQTFYVDQYEKISPQLDLIQIPAEQVKAYTPAFEYREAYFPQSLDYDYATWNKLHIIAENWAVWGHHLDKLINFKGIPDNQRSQLFAFVNNKYNDAQYCFSSEILYNELVKGIEQKKLENPDAIYYSIAPNDNSIVCACERCMEANKSASTCSNSVALLLNSLADKFPNLVFTTNAYLSTLNPPQGIQLKNNIIVLLSTIDFPKGQPLEKSNKAESFRNLVSGWKNVGSELYIWDYTIQYTNYFDFFPNLSALQEDLKFFKKLGIMGVMEQGSEEQYSLFCEWKSFALAKLLWNPDLDLDKLRYDFFEQAYPTQVDFITDYLFQLKDRLKNSGKTLNIYGTIWESIQSYLTPEQFDIFYYDLIEAYSQLSGKEKKRVESVLTALAFDKLEMARSGGLAAFGYAQKVQGDSIKINPEIPVLLTKLHEFSTKTGVQLINERGDSINAYIQHWNKYIINRSIKSKIIDKPIKVLTRSNGEFKGDALRALNDGSFGFTDFEVNWLIFDNASMEVEVPVSSFLKASTLSVSFLQDLRHQIYIPEKLELYTIDAGNSRTKFAEMAMPKSSTAAREIVEVKMGLEGLQNSQKILIVVVGLKNLPDEALSSNKKPSIACDEIQIY